MMQCELCENGNDRILFQDDRLRVILVDQAGYPGFCRVIWRQHVKEMTDLEESDRQHLFRWVMHTEQALREILRPDKINLASLGNMVPHLHWHVIPRFTDDPHFPSPIWANACRAGNRQAPDDLAERLSAALAAKR